MISNKVQRPGNVPQGHMNITCFTQEDTEVCPSDTAGSPSQPWKSYCRACSLSLRLFTATSQTRKHRKPNLLNKQRKSLLTDDQLGSYLQHIDKELLKSKENEPTHGEKTPGRSQKERESIGDIKTSTSPFPKWNPFKYLSFEKVIYALIKKKTENK